MQILFHCLFHCSISEAFQIRPTNVRWLGNVEGIKEMARTRISTQFARSLKICTVMNNYCSKVM